MGVSGKWMKAILGSKSSTKQIKNAPEEEKPDLKLKRSSSKAFWKHSKSERRASTDHAVSTSNENNHALAVATATAAAAEAAAAAASAAAAVARLTSAATTPPPFAFLHVREEWAAVCIQSSIRAFRARQQLGALKSLVKIQALVRGFIIRRHTANTLRSMQALARLQAQVHQQRQQHSKSISGLSQKQLEKMQLEAQYKECEWKPPDAWRNGKKPADDEASKAQSLAWLDWWMSTRQWESRPEEQQNEQDQQKQQERGTRGGARKVKRTGNPKFKDVKSKVAAYINQKSTPTTTAGSRGYEKHNTTSTSNKLSSSRTSGVSDMTYSSGSPSSSRPGSAHHHHHHHHHHHQSLEQGKAGNNNAANAPNKGIYIPQTRTNRHLHCNEMKHIPAINLTRPPAPLRKSPLVEIPTRRRLSISGLGKLSRQNSSTSLKTIIAQGSGRKQYIPPRLHIGLARYAASRSAPNNLQRI